MCICSLKEKQPLFPALVSASVSSAQNEPANESTSTAATVQGAVRSANSLWTRRSSTRKTLSTTAQAGSLAMDAPSSVPLTPSVPATFAASGEGESSATEAAFQSEATADEVLGTESVAEEDESVAEAPVIPVDPARAQFLRTLQRAKEGDKKAFEEIYQLYHRRIYNAVYGMLSDPDDAQDVTQDVFMRLHDALPTLRADEAFSTYLYRIALNLCRDRARRKKRVRFQSMDTPRADSEGDVEPMEFPDAGKLPEETLANDELQTRVRQAVQTLSTDHKAVIVMHHFQGMEVNDIANILKVPTGTVKSRLARGRDQLHRKLKSYVTV